MMNKRRFQDDSGGLKNPANELVFHEDLDDGYIMQRVFFKNNDDTKNQIFLGENKEFIDSIKNELIEIFSKVFGKISPTEVTPKVFIRETNQIDFMKFSKEFECSPMESAFLMLLLLNNMRLTDFIDSKGFPAEEIKNDVLSVVRHHIEEFNSTDFDTAEKINAGLKPWDASLGFNNCKFMRVSDIGIKDVLMLNETDETKKLFLGFVRALEETENNELTVGDFCLPKNNFENEDTFGHYKIYGAKVFCDLPVGNDEFDSWLKKLKVIDLNEILWGGLPLNISSAVMIDLLNHIISSNQNKNKKEVLESSRKIANEVIDMFPHVASSAHAVMEIFDSVFSLAACGDEYRNIAVEVFTVYKDKIFDRKQFNNLNSLLGDCDSGYMEDSEWIEEPVASDYILSKLCDSYGVGKTVQAIEAVRGEGKDFKLSTAQWLWVVDNYDVVENSPVSWWLAMAGES